MEKKSALYRISIVSTSLVAFIIACAPAAVEGGTTQPGAEFKIQELVVPAEASAGDNIVISATVTNSASNDGNYEATLKINGAPEATSVVNVPPRGTRTVSFSITRSEPGNYEVDLDGLKGTVLVVAKSSVPSAGAIAELSLPVVITITVLVLLIVLVAVWIIIRTRTRLKHTGR